MNTKRQFGNNTTEIVYTLKVLYLDSDTKRTFLERTVWSRQLVQDPVPYSKALDQTTLASEVDIYTPYVKTQLLTSNIRAYAGLQATNVVHLSNACLKRKFSINERTKHTL